MSATTSDDVVPELRSVPGEKKKSLKGEGMVGPYSITSTAQGMTDTKKAVIAEYLTKLDAVWGRESPLVKRWREGREGKRTIREPVVGDHLRMVMVPGRRATATVRERGSTARRGTRGPRRAWR